MTQINYGTYTALTTTNLQSLASSATNGWQSDRIDNQSSVKAIDYEIVVKLTTAASAAANDKAAYVYISPAVYDANNTTWYHADGGTTTPPSGTEGTYTIGGVTTTNNLRLLMSLAYTATGQAIQGVGFLSGAVGQTMPDGFSIIIVNYTGAALSTGCVVAYRAIT